MEETTRNDEQAAPPPRSSTRDQWIGAIRTTAMPVIGAVLAGLVMQIFPTPGQVIVTTAEEAGTPPPYIVQNHYYWQNAPDGRSTSNPSVDDLPAFGDQSDQAGISKDDLEGFDIAMKRSLEALTQLKAKLEE